MKEDIFALPIDQFTRQAWVKSVINALRSDGESYKILDVGGHKGKTSLFHNKDKVTICDLFDIKESGYVKTDGKTLPFEDGSFDFVVSFDTYEHVPREQRETFLEEAYRVSKKAVIIAAPFDNEKTREVSFAEKELNDYHQALYGIDHPWLKEHIEYGIPTTAEIEELIKKSNMNFTTIPTNDISVWIIMQTLYLSITLDEDIRGRIDDVNRIFNKNFEKFDQPTDQPYRRIYIISKQDKTIEKAQRYIDSNSNKGKYKTEFVSVALSMFGKKYRDTTRHDQYLEGENIRLKNENDNLVKNAESAEDSRTLSNMFFNKLKKIKASLSIGKNKS